MPPRFDPESSSLEVAVGDLVEIDLLRHLGFANRGGFERRWLGQAIHGHYQEQAIARDPSYRREVPISVSFTHRGWKVTVHGRLDGLRRTPEGAVIEEIKSVRPGARVSGALWEVYARQALLYAWMLRRSGEEPVAVELVWIEIGSQRIEREPLEFRFATIDVAVRKRLNSLLAEFERRQQAASRRRLAASHLESPYPTLRPGQEEIVAAVERVLAHEGHLLIEAPTGLGKTVAALLPALRFALAHDKRIFVLTAKTLQQEMAIQVLRLLNREESFHSLQLRAKAKMCANDQILCHEEYCTFARDYYSKLHGSGLTARLLESRTTLLPDDIFAAARASEVCPFEVSLELSRHGQVVVCDYNYAFDPYVSLSDFHDDSDLRDVILVVDEIHNLVDRGRGYFSPALSSRQALAAAASMAQGREPVHVAGARLCRALAELVTDSVTAALGEVGGDTPAVEAPLPDESLWSMRASFDEIFIDYLEYRRETSSFRADDPFVDLYFGFLRFLDGLLRSEQDGEAFSHCLERQDEDRRLRVVCKDPSRYLGRVINRTHATIGLSATLSPSEFYRDLLGFDRERLETLSLPSPFPEERRRIVIDGSVSTLYRRRPENYPRIARRLSGFADRVPGNCLVLFPSYRFLDEVAARLTVTRKRVLIQSPSSSDREREEILAHLRSALTGDVVLLAVAGGVFAEGVDYPGEMLRAVAVVGPCLPAVTLEQELLRRYYDERFERGFEYAFVVPGMTRVVQAAGRLIRSATDIGVIALFDERFVVSPYREHLPQDWLPGSEIAALLGDPSRVAEDFFGRWATGGARRSVS